MEYISNISFVVSESPVSGVPNMINVDMNSGSEGPYIYPLKHVSPNSSEAISGLAFIHKGSVPSGYTKIDQDLNAGAGGKFNYLCIAKGGPIKMTAITFIARDEKVTDWSLDGYFVFPHDLNTGAKKVGNYVYLLYKTDTGKQFN
jgi:hypothetical protein